MRLSLGTPNQAAAADLAREMFGFLTANGWIGFLAKYRSSDPQVTVAGSTPEKKTSVTVGDFLAAVRDESDLSRKTFDSYATCFGSSFRRSARSRRPTAGTITATGDRRSGSRRLTQCPWQKLLPKMSGH
jgi:hypothetical protein